MTTGCECPIAGYCERHKINKPGRLHDLCKTDQRFFDRWEKIPVVESTQLDPGKKMTPMNTTTLLWKEAHEYAMAHEDNWDEAATRLWYQAWVKRIPKFGCGCQDHWAAITRSNPPQFESPMAFFTWFWARHDEVSRTQSKKPELTLDEAFRIWWPKYADQQNLSTSE
jgi:hypothetical protein